MVRVPRESAPELQKALNPTLQEHYSKQVPITFYTEKLNDGTFYKTEGSAQNPFGKNTGFVKTFSHYKHNLK